MYIYTLYVYIHSMAIEPDELRQVSQTSVSTFTRPSSFGFIATEWTGHEDCERPLQDSLHIHVHNMYCVKIYICVQNNIYVQNHNIHIQNLIHVHNMYVLKYVYTLRSREIQRSAQIYVHSIYVSTYIGLFILYLYFMYVLHPSSPRA